MRLLELTINYDPLEYRSQFSVAAFATNIVQVYRRYHNCRFAPYLCTLPFALLLMLEKVNKNCAKQQANYVDKQFNVLLPLLYCICFPLNFGSHHHQCFL